MQASPEPVSRALFPSGVTTMAIRGVTEAAVMDNLRLEDFCYAQLLGWSSSLEQAPGLGMSQRDA